MGHPFHFCPLQGGGSQAACTASCVELQWHATGVSGVSNYCVDGGVLQSSLHTVFRRIQKKSHRSNARAEVGSDDVDGL